MRGCAGQDFDVTGILQVTERPDNIRAIPLTEIS